MRRKSNAGARAIIPGAVAFLVLLRREGGGGLISGGLGIIVCCKQMLTFLFVRIFKTTLVFRKSELRRGFHYGGLFCYSIYKIFNFAENR